MLSSGSLGNPALPELIEATLAGGFCGLTLWPAAYHPSMPQGVSFDELRTRLGDAGLPVLDVDATVVWAGADDPGGPYYEEAPQDAVLELAAELGATGVTTIVTGGAETSLDDVTEAFATACDRAAAFELRTHLEFSRSRPPADLLGALQVVEQADRPNGGIMLDAWHVHFGPGSFGDVAAIPPGRLTGVQLCDTPEHEPERFGYATRHERELPGEGHADLPGLLRRLAAINCPTPLTVEVFGTRRVEAIGARAFAEQLGEASRSLLAALPG